MDALLTVANDGCGELERAAWVWMGCGKIAVPKAEAKCRLLNMNKAGS